MLNEYTEQIYKDNMKVGHQLFCPDFNGVNMEEVVIQGANFVKDRSWLEFQVLRCTGKFYCAPPDKIDDFISDLEVQMWTTHQQAAF